MVAVDAVVKKLSLWHTPTFRPIMTHDDLEPILAALGFVPLIPSASSSSAAATWREYCFRGSHPAWRPTPDRAGDRRERIRPPLRLPAPRIDGVHFLTFKVFFAALDFYLGPDRAAELFHVRAMSINQSQNRAYDRLYRPMRDCEMDCDGVFLYRDGTLDHRTKSICEHLKKADDIINGKNSDEADPIHVVNLKDLFPQSSAPY